MNKDREIESVTLGLDSAIRRSQKTVLTFTYGYEYVRDLEIADVLGEPEPEKPLTLMSKISMIPKERFG